jgi:hypothetical protein
MPRSIVMASLVVLFTTACESANDKTPPSASAAEGRAAGEIVIDTNEVKGKTKAKRGGGIDPAQLDIEATAALVRRNRVKNGKELEAALNEEQLGRVDVDGDGKRDRLWVVEVVDGEQRTFEVRAVPSSKKSARPQDVAVVVETIEVVPEGDLVEVTVEYGDVVVVDEPPVITFEMPLVADTFCHWVVVIDRPIFIGVAYVIIEERVHHGKYKHKKHKKHRK